MKEELKEAGLLLLIGLLILLIAISINYWGSYEWTKESTISRTFRFLLLYVNTMSAIFLLKKYFKLNTNE